LSKYETTREQQQQQQHEQEEQNNQEFNLKRIYLVTEGLRSTATVKAYRIAFTIFIQNTIKNDSLQALLYTKQNLIESKIIDHITYLKDARHLTCHSIRVHLSGIFLEINDFYLNTKKIKRFMPQEGESDYYAKDRPYSVKEIE
jgi:hypothetical protein